MFFTQKWCNITLNRNGALSDFLPLLRHFNPAEPMVEKSVILLRIKMSRAFSRMLSNR
jgi:hypothetical protein